MSRACTLCAAAAGVALCLPMAASAQVILGCIFEGIPPVVLHYPDDPAQAATLSVDNRPAAELTRGSGWGRVEAATVDGYRFEFVPSAMTMSVYRDDRQVASGAGACARFGGPENQTPLSFAAPPAAASSSVDAPADDARAPDAQAARPEEGTGAWDVSISTSSLDDSTTVVLSLDSDTVLAKRFGGFDTPRMILRCKENTTSFYIVVAGHHLTDIQSYGRITYRLDQQPAATLDALASTDSKALGLWTGRSAIPFIKSLANARKLVARVTPYSESPKEFTFDLTGLSQALVPLRQSCKW